jgi:tellurite resistance protein
MDSVKGSNALVAVVGAYADALAEACRRADQQATLAATLAEEVKRLQQRAALALQALREARVVAAADGVAPRVLSVVEEILGGDRS